MAGILMFTDGRWTVGADPLDTVKAHASLSTAEGRIAGGVWAVPVGSSKPAPDVGIIDVIAPARVTLGDRASVDATIESQGLEARKVSVKLLGPDGKQVDVQPLTLATGQRPACSTDLSGRRRRPHRADRRRRRAARGNRQGQQQDDDADRRHRARRCGSSSSKARPAGTSVSWTTRSGATRAFPPTS